MNTFRKLALSTSALVLMTGSAFGSDAAYQPISSLSALAALKAASSGVRHANVDGIGNYDWYSASLPAAYAPYNVACPGAIDGSKYVAATDVATTSCWVAQSVILTHLGTNALASVPAGAGVLPPVNGGYPYLNAAEFPGSDIGAKANAAIASLSGAFGNVFVPGGSLMTTPIVVPNTVCLFSDSNTITVPTTSDVIWIDGLQDGTLAVQDHGCINNFRIIPATTAGTNVTVIRYGNAVGFTVRDNVVANFSNTDNIGYKFENVGSIGFTEHALIFNNKTDVNTHGFVFQQTGAQNSFGHNHFISNYCETSSSAAQNCVEFNGGAYYYQGEFTLVANLNSTSSSAIYVGASSVVTNNPMFFVTAENHGTPGWCVTSYGAFSIGSSGGADCGTAGFQGNVDLYFASGSWTPLWAGSSGGTAAGTSQDFGWWRKQGDLITAGGIIQSAASFSGLTGDMRINGLTYAANSTTGQWGSCSFGLLGGVTLTAGYAQINASIVPGADYIRLGQFGSGQAYADIPVSGFATSALLQFTCQYHK